MNTIKIKNKTRTVNLTMESLLIYRMTFRKDMIVDIFYLIELLQSMNNLVEYDIDTDNTTGEEKVVGAYIDEIVEYTELQNRLKESNILINLLWTMLYTANQEKTGTYFSFNKNITDKELINNFNFIQEIMNFVSFNRTVEQDNITNDDLGIDKDIDNKITTDSIFITCNEVGLTMEHLKYMTLGNCMEYINQYNKIQKEVNNANNNDRPTVRKATQADIDAFIYG